MSDNADRLFLALVDIGSDGGRDTGPDDRREHLTRLLRPFTIPGGPEAFFEFVGAVLGPEALEAHLNLALGSRLFLPPQYGRRPVLLVLAVWEKFDRAPEALPYIAAYRLFCVMEDSTFTANLRTGELFIRRAMKHGVPPEYLLAAHDAGVHDFEVVVTAAERGMPIEYLMSSLDTA